MNLTREERKELDEALRDAYDYTSFEKMLSYELDKSSQDFLIGGSFTDLVFKVISTSEREGWTANLIRSAHDANPGNPRLHALAKKKGLAFDTPSPDKLRHMLSTFSTEFDLPANMSQTEQYEHMMIAFSRELGLAPNMLNWQKNDVLQPESTLFDIASLTRKITELQRHVCAIELDGQPSGTGFRIAPDLVLTAYHVAEQAIKSTDRTLSIRFDFLADDSGAINQGERYALPNSDWLFDESIYSSHDVNQSSQNDLPSTEELSYAILKVENLEDRPGFIALPAEKIDYAPGGALHILQHIRGMSMKLAFQPNSMIAINENRTRFFYRTLTGPGSSGAPCFDHNWNLVGFHIARSMRGTQNYKIGVPITAVVRLLEEKGLSLG